MVPSAMLLFANILLTLNYFFPVYALDLPVTFNVYLVTAGLVWMLATAVAAAETADGMALLIGVFCSGPSSLF